MKVLSVVLLLVSAIIGSTFGENEACPSNSLLPTNEVFKKDEFAKITWKEVKRTSNDYAKGDCVSVKYSKVDKKDNDLSASYAFYAEKKKQEASYVLEYSKLNGVAFDHKNNFKVKSGDKAFDDMDYRILLTDYKTYFVAYACGLTGDDGKKKRNQRISVFTKDGIITETIEAMLEPVLAGIPEVPKFSDKSWSTVEQDMKKCSSASIFGVSTILSVIVVMLSVLRN